MKSLSSLAVHYALDGGLFISPHLAKVIVRDYLLVNRQRKALPPMKNLTVREKEIVRHIIDGWKSKEIAGTGPALRLWLLSASYLKSLAYSPESLVMWVKNRLLKFRRYARSSTAQRCRHIGILQPVLIFDPHDNLDLAHFWPALFAFAKTVNSRAGKMSVDEAALVAEQLLVCDRVLGYLDHARLPGQNPLPCGPPHDVRPDRQPRAARIFQPAADALRVELAEMGLRLEDHPAGVRLFRRT